MASVATYLNFDGDCLEAFEFYRSVFGGEFLGEPMRMKEMPPSPDMPPLAEGEGERIMHMALGLPGGHQLMGSDIMPSMGQVLTVGNQYYVTLLLDSEDELKDLFDALSAGGEVSMPPQPMFWGDLYADFTDRFGIQWMMIAPLEEELGHA
ncbi:VOC family protein [Demequina pelophila]|uniref:VOC family protein n=1 Tax=Demequina pelophila TaxID=1638984 RepID=UPI00078610B2|nr:VOC family protein [Demequina pelophila]